MSIQTPPRFDGRQVQWVARTFSVEGVVRDYLVVSDAGDLSQLTTVERNQTWPIPLVLVRTYTFCM